MNYLSVPDSNLKLTEGTVVVLYRLPGVKWIVHYGWYSYNGGQFMGWYFSSIPSQTILPVSNEDLRMITVVPGSGSDPMPCPGPGPFPPGPTPPPGPGPGPYPPQPPSPEVPAFFSEGLKKQLLSAFITVSTLEKLNELDTSDIPSGKIVRVNNVDGEVKYYAWSLDSESWVELKFATTDEVEHLLEDYYTSEEVDARFDIVEGSISDIQSDILAVKGRVSETEEDLASLQQEFEYTTDRLDAAVTELQQRVSECEVKSVEILGEGTMLADASFDVSTGTLTLTRGNPPAGAMHFLGISSTPITDGGREHPKIDGSVIDTGELHAGDVVLYSPSGNTYYQEFVWCIDSTGTGHWSLLGDESSFVPSARRIIAGEGLSGGGTLDNDVTLYHGATGSGSDTTLNITDDGLISYVTGVTVDKFGHVTGLVSKTLQKEDLLQELGYEETELTFISNGASIKLLVLAKEVPDDNGGG